MFENELEPLELLDDEFDQGTDEEAAEEIELLVRCVHAARLSGA